MWHRMLAVPVLTLTEDALFTFSLSNQLLRAGVSEKSL